MASTTKKWLIGCGIGCGLFILLIAAIGGGVFFMVKDVVKEGKSIDASNEAMVEAFGSPEEFTPALDGSIPPERMDIFLAVRDSIASERAEMAATLSMLDDKNEDQNPVGKLTKIKAGLKLVPAVINFLGQRNQQLLDAGMGDGEYTYIYTLAFFDYLGKDVADGPGFQMSNDSGEEDGGINMKIESKKDKAKVRRKRERQLRRYLHGLQQSFLENQLTALKSSTDPDLDLMAMLEEESEAMAASSRRLLWEDGLPAEISDSLAGYRARLEKSYVPIMNAIEVGLASRD